VPHPRVAAFRIGSGTEIWLSPHLDMIPTYSPSRKSSWNTSCSSAEQHGVHFSNGFVDGNAFHALAEIGQLIEAGRFWLPVERTFPLADIAEAHRVSETGHVRGPLVLVGR
jgi:NADPH:quinone reductase-like Zn-dependent oxidoreductase